MTRRVLVIEDEYDLADIMALNLRRSGFEVTVARSGADGLVEARRNKPDLVLLDLMLPDLAGNEVCRQLRADSRTRGTAIIIVTARGEEIDRVVGFELGADDYLVKPISMRELVLRARAVLRRGAPPAADDPGEVSFETGTLKVDGPGFRVFVEGQVVPLSATEFRLLVALAGRRERVVTRETLIETVWGVNADVEDRTVDAVVKRLRDKLGPAGTFIETVRGVGYRFAQESPPPGAPEP